MPFPNILERPPNNRHFDPTVSMEKELYGIQDNIDFEILYTA